MTASALWQFDQLSPEARHAAEAAARDAGLSLDHWFGRLIAETAAAEGIVLGDAPRVVAPPPPIPPRPAPSVQPRAVVQSLPIRPAPRVAASGLQAGPAAPTVAQPVVQTMPFVEPAMAKNSTDSEAVLASLRENLRQGALSPIDEARAYLRLLTEFSLAPRDIHGAVGCDLTHIVRTLRLLGLSPRLRGFIADGRLSSAQAYALLDTPDPERAADKMLSELAGVDEASRRITAVSREQHP